MGNLQRAFYKAVEEKSQEKQRLVDATNAYQKAHAQKSDKGLVYYTDDYRKEIYEQAKSLGFSPQDLEKMAYYLDSEHWNQDEIRRAVNDQIIDAIDLFYKAEQFLNDNAQRKSWSVRLYDALASLGNHIDKEDNTNDN